MAAIDTVVADALGSRDRWLPLHAQVNEQLTAEAGTLDPASYDRTHLDALRAAVCFRLAADGTFHGDFAGNGAVAARPGSGLPDVLPDLAQIRAHRTRGGCRRRPCGGHPRGVHPADLLMAANSRSNAGATVDKAFAASCKAHAANSPPGCDNSVPITTVRRPDGQLRVRTEHPHRLHARRCSRPFGPAGSGAIDMWLGPPTPSCNAAANPGRPAQLSPAARWNVWAMILYPAWLACWFGPRGGAAQAHVHWHIRATLRGTVPIPGTVT